MNRRRLLRTAAAAIPLLPSIGAEALGPTRGTAAVRSMSRVRPGDPAWPSDTAWNRLNRDVEGQLVRVESPLAACMAAPEGASCAQILKELRNPYYLGDEVALRQSLGWVDAWTSRPSVYAVAARRTEDVAAAVSF